MKRFFQFIILFAVFFFFIAPKAHAYLEVEYRFISNNRANIDWQVGFRMIGNYEDRGSWKYSKVYEEWVETTSCITGVQCAIGTKQGVKRANGKDLPPQYGMQWGTGCIDPKISLGNAQRRPDGTWYYTSNNVNVTFSRSNLDNLGVPAYTYDYLDDIAWFEDNGGKNIPFPSGFGFNCPKAPRYSIDGRVFIDDDRDGNRDAGEAYRNGLTVRKTGDSNESDSTHDASGTPGYYRFFNLPARNNYRVWLNIPNGYSCTTNNGCNVSSIGLPPNRTYNFGIAPANGPISGTVFLPNGNPYRGNAFVIRNNVNNRDQTNNQGDYNFGGLQAGSRHDITLSHVGDGLNLPGGNGNKVDTCLYSANWTRQNIQAPNNSVNFRLNNQTYAIGGQLLWDPDGSGGGTDTRPYTSPTGRNVRVTVRGQGSDITNNQARYSIGGIPTDSDGIKYTVEVDTSGADGIKPAHHVVGGNTRRVTISCANRPNVNFFIGPEGYDISGTIYVDDGDGVLDPGAGANRDQPYTGSYGGQFATVTVDNVRSDNVNGSGAYTVAGNPNGSRSVRLNINTLRPSYRNIITPPGNPRIVAVSGADRANINFLIARTPPSIWSLSGGLFIDTDPSRQRNGELYTNPLNPEKILINNRNLNTYADSRFDATGFYVPGLSAGVYDVEFPTPIRQNFVVSYHPGRYRITLGSTPNCPPPSTCNADGDAENIDFGISDNPTAQSWIQGVGGFMRSDQELSVTIPSGKYLSITSAQDSPSFPTLLSPGVIFNFNLSGNVSSKGWLVTNSAYRPQLYHLTTGLFVKARTDVLYQFICFNPNF